MNYYKHVLKMEDLETYLVLQNKVKFGKISTKCSKNIQSINAFNKSIGKEIIKIR